MAATTIDLLQENEWAGVFYFDRYEERFAGKLKYTPKNGITVEFHRLITAENLGGPSLNRIYGILENGVECTIVGNFQARLFSLNFGVNISQGGSWPAKYVIFGKHVGEQDLFDEMHFSFKHAQEFFFPKSFMDDIKFQKGDILTADSIAGKISLKHEANFKCLPNQLESFLYSEDQDVIPELQKKWNEIKKQNPASLLAYKTDLSCTFTYKSESQQKPDELFEIVQQMADLLAIINNIPIHPSKLALVITDPGETHAKTLRIAASLNISSETIGLANIERQHLRMPITADKINFGAIIEKWIGETARKYSSVISSIQYDVGYKTIHELHGDVVLFLTQIEDINKLIGGKAKEKYDNPIKNLASKKLEKLLMEKLKINNDGKFGARLSDLRAEIAHVGKKKTLINSITITDLSVIVLCLKLVVQSYILHDLGISKELLHEFQDHFTPRLDSGE